MTEAEWLTCSDPLPKVTFLRGIVSDRKLRLFAAACSRRLWHLLTDGRSKKAVEVAELYADGMAGSEDLEAAHNEAWTARNLAWDAYSEARSSSPDIRGLAVDTAKAASDAARLVLRPPSNFWDAPKIWTSPWVSDEFPKQCGLLRCILGPLPFRPVTLNPAWLTWNHATIPKLAQTICDDRELPSGHFDTGRLAILADALEEAGCTSTEILNHCRQPGVHVRGCWLVDLLLGKE